MDQVSVRLLGSIAYRYLREPLRHQAKCDTRCVKNCDVLAFHQALAEPVLPSEIEAAKREEQRFKALAAGDFLPG